MKKYSGNLISYLNEQTKDNIAAEKAKSQYTIINIDVDKIIPNSRNFYGIRDVEQLAASMALSGHVSPLEVTPLEDGNYRLISGERRRAAVKLRLERGEITDGAVPCIVRETFRDGEKLSAEHQEIINIIAANDYRDKTPFEKLEEITELEPIARIYFVDERQNGYDGDFRKFFAKKFLGVSVGVLQRILVLRKLVPEAKEAYNNGLIRKTALSELAGKPENFQRQYLAKLAQGEVGGSIEDIQQEESTANVNNSVDNVDNLDTVEAEKFSSSDDVTAEADLPSGNKSEGIEENSVDSNDADSVVEAENTNEEDFNGDAEIYNEMYGDKGQPGEQHNTSETIPDNTSSKVISEAPEEKSPNNFSFVSPDEAQKEADSWVQNGICNMMLEAAEEAQRAKENGDKLAAAQWDLRRAAANFVLETIR